MNRFKMYPGAVGGVMRSPQVRAALRTEAERIVGRAEQIAAQENYEVHAYVEEDIRPKGRPTARVRSNDADQEFGTYGKKRLRILGRAADLPQE